MKLIKIKVLLVFSVLFSWANHISMAQGDTAVVQQDAIYNRPFINASKSRTAVGGYLEMNTNYFSEDGVSEGFGVELRRFNIFLYSQIADRIRFLSEIEFEPADEEIKIETAILDFEFNSALNLRGGILLPAVGLVNTNHDSPQWEFVERPLSSTRLIPTTLSEVGFGIFGKLYPSVQQVISYDAYIVSGLQDGIIFNEAGHTNLAAGKTHEMFGEDNNGMPMYNARLGFANRKWGEIGLTWYGGVYNRFRADGIKIDDRRALSLTALDWQINIFKATIQGEYVWVSVDVPEDVREIYGERQRGGFVDIIYPVVRGSMFGYENSMLNASIRLETVDLNAGSFFTNIAETIGDEESGIALGLGWRPVSGTIVRFNYRYSWRTDNLGNPPAKIGGIQAGLASYF